jgi:predicted Zn-dependent protease
MVLSKSKQEQQAVSLVERLLGSDQRDPDILSLVSQDYEKLETRSRQSSYFAEQS